MRITTYVLPVGALALGALLLTPSESHGWSTIGGSLGQAQRDVRIYNNFTDASANNNTTPDPDWPGYLGAELSIWKGSAEWASELHGLTGAGDPLQTVGSGGGNFDISWQGLATSIGNSNSNVHSEIGGSGGGVLAYTETPISDGWRIRYYRNWTWQDGPGNPGGGIDLQGVACHEYGHALGLGHSTNGQATMFPSISGNGTAARSINSDDKGGVQFVYGALDAATKPHLSAVTYIGNTVTVIGNNFAGTGNELWFTQAGAGGGGTPVKATNLNSNGTSVSALLPGNAGAGDILVKKGGVGGHKGISNAFPFDPTAGPNPYAENLNVDLGTGMGTPGSGQAGAANNTGTWTGVPLPTVGTSLRELDGTMTAALFSHTGSGGEKIEDHPSTGGFWEKLFDDRHDLGCLAGVSTATYEVTGMKAGLYDVYVYAWAPEDGPNSFTDIHVTGGAQGTQSCGGVDYNGGVLLLGGHYVKDTVTVNNDGDAIEFTATTTAMCGGVNGFQILPGSACGVATNYCTAGTSASGCNAVMSTSGTPSASAASGFSLIATAVEGNKDGLFFFGTNGQQANPWGSSTSFQCVTPPVARGGLLPSSGTAGACDGQFSQDLNALWTASPPKNPGAGADVNAQLWYRDPQNTSNQTTSLSDAVNFKVCP